ncbi:MAG: DNA methylase [Anaerorhabdus sp.]
MKYYACIDLKSFFASVECLERNLDPLLNNLVVADNSKTEKTICLAITPPLKQYGLSGRSRLFEVVQRIRLENIQRKNKFKRNLIGSSINDQDLKKNLGLSIDYIIAKPQMAKYIKYSTEIYEIYLKYISHDDIFPYSIDEVFMDITPYLRNYSLSPRDLIKKIILDIYKTTGITATAGIGNNMYLAKVAMDIMAKRIKKDEDGVRIAYLDEKKYRELLWDHQPITDFWRVGKGTAKRLEEIGIYTMGDVARCSLNKADKENSEYLLHKIFGVSAELLIDHAWGYEPCSIKDVKQYTPNSKSLTSGQVLLEPYTFKKCEIVIKEMIDALSLDLISKNLLTNQLSLSIAYDIENLNNREIKYNGDIITDNFGRKMPKPISGRISLTSHTSSSNIIISKMVEQYNNIVNKDLLIRKINISVNNLIDKDSIQHKSEFVQLDIFSNNDVLAKEEKEEETLQKALLKIKNKYGKNAVLKGTSYLEGATAKDRNKKIGGHNA